MPWCHVVNVGYSYLLKTVPEDGGWAMEAHVLGACISHGWPEILRIELFNGSYEYIAGKDIALGALPNSAATGGPTISGTPTVGQTLTASASNITDTNGLDNAAYTYQWIRSDSATDTDISGATGTTYLVTIDDVGKAIKVRVTFTDDAGNEESLTSAATEAVAAKPNSPATGQPAISGTAQVGETVTADTSSITDADGVTKVTFSYQWIRNDGASDADIQNVTGSTYTLVSDDEGKTIKVRVSFTDDEGNKETLTSSATTTVEAQANSELVSYINVYLSVTESTSDPDNIVTNFTITWFDADDCTTDYNAYLNIAAGNRPGQETPGSQHHLGSVASDGAQISNGLSGIRGALEGFNVELYCGSAESGRLVSRVRIPRGAGVGPFIGLYSSEPPLSALNVSHGTLTPTFNSHTFHYTVSDIANADTRITIAATPKTGFGGRFVEADADPARLALAAYSGSPSGPPSGLSEYCNWGVADRFGSLVELTDADPDTPGFQVDLYDGENHIDVWVYRTAFCEEPKAYLFAISRAEGSVSLVRPNRPATGGVYIDLDRGRLDPPWPGLTLRTDTDHSNFRDRDGLTNPSYTYQWLADDAEIAGETSTEYRVKLADMGKTLKVRVSFTDDRGIEETRTSRATRAIKRRNHWPEGKPIIRGTLEVGQTLTADISGISDPNGMTNATFSYRWKYIRHSGSPSTDSEYTLVSRDEGTSVIGLEVTYTDDDGHEETLSTWRRGEVAPSPTKATGAPVITGVAQVGETLAVGTSGIADGDGLANVSYRYRWGWPHIWPPRRSTDSTYTVVDADEGLTIKVRVSFTDDAGFEETLISAPTAAVVAATTPGAPRSVDVQPAGTGGLSLSWQEPASNGGSAISGYTVEWKKAADSWDTDEDVSEATVTDTIHTITGLELDVGYTVRVIATNFVGDGPASDEVTGTPVAQTSQQQAAAQNTPAAGAPTISGTAQVGEMLTVDTSAIADEDGLDNAVFSYQWIANDGTADADIQGATGTTYTLADTDEGKTIKVRVRFTDDAGNEETLASAASAVVEVPLTAELQNVPESHNGEDAFTFRILFSEPVTVGYQALKEDSFEISDGTITSARRVNGRDDLRQFTVRPSSNLDVAIVLRADRPCDDEGAICTSDGKRLFNRLALTVPGPAPANALATGAPTINGTAQVGQTLTATTSNIADSDGLVNAAYSYQWVRNDGGTDAEIQDATGSTYTLDTADEGKTVKVRVSFTDDAGNDESLTSAATDTVAVRANSPATGLPTISGTAQVDETLTAETSAIADEDGLSNVAYNYQWLADDTDIARATGSSYTLADADEGKTVKVRVSFTDDGGNQESLTSAPTAMVSTPLTAGFQWMPASHNGRDEFTIFIQFSEEIASSYVTLRDHALTVTGGEVVSADVFGYSDLWALGIDPDGNGDVTIALPITTDCSATGAVCTGGGKKLSNHIEHTVSGPAHANSVATGIPTITGTAQVGETLTAGTSGISDEDGLTNATFSYQWVRNDGGTDAEIQGATDSTYDLSDADVGKTVKVRVSFTDDAGNKETLTSAATAEVAARPNSPATGAPAIRGTVQVDETLTADTSGIADADGLQNATFSHQWVSSDGVTDSDIPGETGATYEVAPGDAGQDDQGEGELHRRRGQRGDPDQRGHGRRGGDLPGNAALPAGADRGHRGTGGHLAGAGIQRRLRRDRIPGPVEAGHRQLGHGGGRLLRDHNRDLLHHHQPGAGHRVRGPRHRRQRGR